MKNKKSWVLPTLLFLPAATAVWAAQTKAPSKTAPGKETAKAAAPAVKTAAAEKPKEHQATGTVASFTETSLVISKTVGKKKSDWTFARNAQTKTQGTLAKDAKVTVYYYQDNDQKIARRVKVLEAKSAGKPPAKSAAPPASKSKAAKPKPQS